MTASETVAYGNNLKILALNSADGDLAKAKAIYAWLIEDPPSSSEAAKPARTTRKKADEPVADKGDTGVETPAPEAKKEPTAPPALDYVKDIQPAVLKAIPVIGKDAALGIIKRFGAEHASKIDPAKWPEFLEAIMQEVEAHD